MIDLKKYEVWFITGSQHLYGSKTLEQVAENSREIANHLDNSPNIPVRVIVKPTVKTSDEITAICLEANTSPKCIGLVMWMHTFSPKCVTRVQKLWRLLQITPRWRSSLTCG